MKFVKEIWEDPPEVAKRKEEVRLKSPRKLLEEQKEKEAHGKPAWISTRRRSQSAQMFGDLKADQTFIAGGGPDREPKKLCAPRALEQSYPPVSHRCIAANVVTGSRRRPTRTRGSRTAGARTRCSASETTRWTSTRIEA